MSITSENSAYVIMIEDDNSMIVTQKQRIVQRSKLVDNLWFLVKPEYNGYSMSNFTAVLEYLSPVSHKYRTEFLVQSDSTYNGYLKYTLPFDTNLTAEAGEIKLQITFATVELDDEGKSVQRVRKVTGVNIVVVPILAWSDIIPDDALSALDQRIIKTDAQIKALSDLSESLYHTKADDISYNEDNNELQLLAGGAEIGRKIILKSLDGSLDDGIPVVDFSTQSGNDESPDEDDNVIEF